MERGEIAFRFRANDGINCMLAWQIYVLQGMLRNTIAFICDFPGGGGGGPDSLSHPCIMCILGDIKVVLYQDIGT